MHHNCSVCKHPDLHAIDRTLMAGGHSLRALGQKFGLSKSALNRHHTWLRRKMGQAAETFHQQQQQELLFFYNEFLLLVREVVHAARDEGDRRQTIQASREGVRILNAIKKLDARPDQDTLYRLHTTREGLTRQGFLPADHAFILDSRQALADYLAAPCPDLDLTKTEAFWEELAADKADAEHCRCLRPPRPQADGLEDLLARLDLNTAAQAPAAPRRRRDKGGTKPKKYPSVAKKIKLNQKDKTYLKNPAAQRDKSPPATLAEADLASFDPEASYQQYLREKAAAFDSLQPPAPSGETRHPELAPPDPQPAPPSPDLAAQDSEAALKNQDPPPAHLAAVTPGSPPDLSYQELLDRTRPGYWQRQQKVPQGAQIP